MAAVEDAPKENTSIYTYIEVVAETYIGLSRFLEVMSGRAGDFERFCSQCREVVEARRAPRLAVPGIPPDKGLLGPHGGIASRLSCSARHAAV